MLAAVASIIVFRKSKTAIIVALCMIIILLYLCSTPFVAGKLADLIEPEAVFDPARANEAQAIVVLGCGTYINAPEYQGADDVSACGLIRMRYALEIYAKTGLPVMTCGGQAPQNRGADPTAEVMARTFEKLFGVATTWQENTSSNTYSNAKNAAAILKPQNIDSIILVTHATHMKRAQYSFEKNGIKVIPAPTDFKTRADSKLRAFDFLPSMSALGLTRDAVHEFIGFIWYAIKLN